MFEAESHSCCVQAETTEARASRLSKVCTSTAQRHQAETAEARAARLSTDCTSIAQRRDIQHVNKMKMNNKTTEIINDSLENDLTQQYEEG